MRKKLVVSLEGLQAEIVCDEKIFDIVAGHMLLLEGHLVLANTDLEPYINQACRNLCKRTIKQIEDYKKKHGK